MAYQVIPLLEDYRIVIFALLP